MRGVGLSCGGGECGPAPVSEIGIPAPLPAPPFGGGDGELPGCKKELDVVAVVVVDVVVECGGLCGMTTTLPPPLPPLPRCRERCGGEEEEEEEMWWS